MTETAIFLILSVISIVAGIFVVYPRNPIYSAFSLLLMMISLALIFLQLAAPFLAIMQVVVYAGAVVVLFLFVIMLMNLDPVELGEEKGFWFKAISFFLVAFMALFLCVAIYKSKEGLPARFPPAAGSAGEAAERGVNPHTQVNVRDTELGRLNPDFGSTERVGTTLFEPYVVPFELISVLIVIAVVGAVVLTKRETA
jgi:NADH-quinone oxidoreductase subunit J